MFPLLSGHQDTQPSSSLQPGYVTNIYAFSSRGFGASLRLSTASGMRSHVCWPIKPPTGLGSHPTHLLNWEGGSSHFLLEAESLVERAWLPEWPCERPPDEDPKTELHMGKQQMFFCAESPRSCINLSSLQLKHWPGRLEPCSENRLYCFHSWSSYSFNSHYLYSSSLLWVFPIS